jgi:hypothetical protein
MRRLFLALVLVGVGWALGRSDRQGETRATPARVGDVRQVRRVVVTCPDGTDRKTYELSVIRNRVGDEWCPVGPANSDKRPAWLIHLSTDNGSETDVRLYAVAAD